LGILWDNHIGVIGALGARPNLILLNNCLTESRERDTSNPWQNDQVLCMPAIFALNADFGGFDKDFA